MRWWVGQLTHRAPSDVSYNIYDRPLCEVQYSKWSIYSALKLIVSDFPELYLKQFSLGKPM